ncbi:DUF6452 family protein [Wenyingzhuangia sp. 1_MG-2023]|nr:DUF6452 family protein [Wenyingzhuangia sp. 1_MG-2023]
MKKTFFLFLSVGFLATLFSCQDEFCLEPTTPNLTVRFYDKDTVENTKALNLIVWIGSGTDSVALPDYVGTSIDSLSLPLDTQNTLVDYHFAILDSVGSQEEISITYSTEDVYVSKACGFKSIFHDVTFTNTTNSEWLSKSEQLSTEITNETEAHVKIFH